MLAEVAVKVVVYSAALMVVGISAVRWMLLPRVAAADGVEPALARIAVASWALLVVALALRASAHTAAVFGPADSIAWESLKTIAINSRWGEAWRLQVAVAGLGLASAIAARRWRTFQIVSGALSVAMAIALARSGHAAGSPLRLTLHSVHIVGGGTWLGALAVIAWLAAGDRDARERFLRTFWFLAIAGVSALALTGTWAASEYVGTIPNLWTTMYGRVLVVKLGLVIGAAGCGYVNWRSFRSARTSHAAPALCWELVLAAAIVIVTGVLTELAHP